MKKISKNIIFGFGVSTAIVAPVTTLVACGSKTSGNHLNISDLNKGLKAEALSNLSKNFFETYNQFALTKIDVLNQIINTKDYGFLDVTNLNAHEWNYNTNQDVFTEKHSEKYLEIATKDLKPVYEKEVTKSDITSGAYSNVSKEINDLITTNPSERFGIYATEVVKDTKGSDTLFKNGKYKIQVFKMKNDGDKETKLNSAINLLKSDKFAPAIEMVKRQQAYNIPRLMNYYVRVNDFNNISSYERNGRESLIAEDLPENTNKNATVWKDYQNGESTPTKNNPNNFKHGSLALMANYATTKNFDLLNDSNTLKNIRVHTSVEHSRKDEAMNLVMTVTYNEAPWGRNSSDQDASKDFRVHTIRIPMPEISNFASNEKLDISATKNLLSYNFNLVYIENLINSLKGNMNMLDEQHFDETKTLILELLSRMQFASKANKLLSNDAALTSFANWTKNKYSAFDLATFNKLMTKAQNENINAQTIIFSAIHGIFPPSIFTLLGEMNKFYDLLERFVYENPQFNSDIVQTMTPELMYQQQLQNSRH